MTPSFPPLDRPARLAALEPLLRERILVLDGAMGTMLQRARLSEEEVRGGRFAGWPHDLRGNLDFCNTIRTVVLRDGVATLQAGAGIVADSDPSAEERETEAKAGALFEALRLAARL